MATKENVDLILAHSAGPVGASEETVKEVARLLAELLEGWCKNFPIRRLSGGEVGVYTDRTGRRVFLGKDIEWVVRGPGLVASFNDLVRESVGKDALVFRLSPIIEFVIPGPVIWLYGHVVPREYAHQMGYSFNKEVGFGHREWKR